MGFGRGEGWLTGYVLGEELAALCSTYFVLRVPESFDGQVVVSARHDPDVSCGGMAYLGTVAQELDVHIRHDGRVLGRICDIDLDLKGKR